MMHQLSNAIPEDRFSIASLAGIILRDPLRMCILRQVSFLGLPDCWVAAGFIRNLVWDTLHGFHPTPLNDVDVIYYDPDDGGSDADLANEALQAATPSVRWDVKNQARMHLRNGDAPYISSSDAMSHWPEIETAVGARIGFGGEIEICAPFGIDGLMAGRLTPNPKRALPLFVKRVASKGWLQKWPKLCVAPPHHREVS